MIGLRRKQLFSICFVIMAYLVCVSAAFSQTFSSGSTGADGAFSPTSSQTIQVPPSGVFNYTTINIPSSVTITYTRNTNNTPVTLLATGNVTILGKIVIDGHNQSGSAGGIGGPGGFDGGSGGVTKAGATTTLGFSGAGPGGGLGGGNGDNAGGGGYAEDGQTGSGDNIGGTTGLGGTHYGSNNLQPLIGGSGGGGGAGFVGSTNNTGGGGGGGGGAIFIASSGTISFGDLSNPTATISAQGGNGDGGCGISKGGGGAGGGIRLTANTISGIPNLLVLGGAGVGCGGGFGGGASPGFVRVEAFDLSNFRLRAPVAHITLSQPTSVNSNIQLKITSVAGINAPTNPAASFLAPPDIVVPSTVANPVTVAISAANIPTGTVVQLTVIPIAGTRTTVSSSALSGTLASSTATASINLPAVTSVITASATVNLSGGSGNRASMLINGERVVSMEIQSTFGGKSEVTYVTASGHRVKME